MRRPAAVPDRETHSGRESFIANLAKFEESFDALRMEPLEIVDLDDRVIVVVSMRARGRGRVGVTVWTRSGSLPTAHSTTVVMGAAGVAAASEFPVAVPQITCAYRDEGGTVPADNEIQINEPEFGSAEVLRSGSQVARTPAFTREEASAQRTSWLLRGGHGVGSGWLLKLRGVQVCLPEFEGA